MPAKVNLTRHNNKQKTLHIGDNKTKSSFVYNIDAETGVIEKRQEDTEEDVFEDDKPFLTNGNTTAEKFNATETLNEATEFPKGKQSIAIEHFAAELASAGARYFTAWLFKPVNAMTEEEAKSTTVPSIRMVQRRIDKWLKIKLPISKMSKEDKADIEETVTALLNYIMRISAQAFNRFINGVKKKQPQVVTHTQYTDHEMRILAARQRARREAENGSNEPANGNMTPELKQALIMSIGGDNGELA